VSRGSHFLRADTDGQDYTGRTCSTTDLRTPPRGCETFTGDPSLEGVLPGDPMPLITCPACKLNMLRDAFAYSCRCGWRFVVEDCGRLRGGLAPRWDSEPHTDGERARRVAVVRAWVAYRRDKTQTHELEGC